jgi:multidrug transporter EmrE-like cation transporter
LYYSGLTRIKETTIVPVLASVETVIAALIGFIAFGQELGIGKIAGIALVLCSIVVMNIKKTEETEGHSE